MRAMIIGSNGMLGRALVKRLQEKEWEIIEQNTLGIFNLDGALEDGWRGWLKYYKPDVLFLVGAMTHVNRCENDSYSWRINMWSPIQLALYCEEFGIKFVFISSFYVFDGKMINSFGWNEVHAPKNPLNVYGMQKSMVEDFLFSRSEMNYLIFRSSAIFAYDDPKKMNILWQVLRGDEEFDDTYKFNPLSAKAFAHIMVREVEKDTCGIIQVGSESNFTKYLFAQVVYDALGLNKSVLKRQEKYGGSVERPVNGCMVIDGEHSVNIRNELLDELSLWKQNEEVELLHNSS